MMGIRKCKTVFSKEILSKDFTKIKTGRPEEQARKQYIMAIAERAQETCVTNGSKI
ncbi:MAG TPA: hypothetical protein VFM18_03380 [Methanosarcina sp.]|nr:hypothetical protein [Methanosarcina sp.]